MIAVTADNNQREDNLMTMRRDVIRRPESLPQRSYGLESFFRRFLDEYQIRSPPIELPAFWVPQIDIYETSSAVLLEIEIPGMSPNDFDFTISDDLIRIKGEKRRTVQEVSSSFRRTERSYGVFERILRLPAEVSEERVGAIYQDGILKLTLTKKIVEEHHSD